MNGKTRLMVPGVLLGTLTAASAIAATNLDGLQAGVAAPPMVLAQRGEGRPGKREDKETGRQSMEVQSEERRREMEEEASGAAERTREEREELERRREQSQGEEPKGLEQQRERKMEQEQKELGKGSEQGQESREQRKKWWRFWE